MALSSRDPLADSFTSTETLDIRERIGQGGMGVVYRAYDRSRDSEVALKTLPHLDDTAIYRLKKEFRSLADVAHPNLVALHELVFEEPHWFFTMELVHGVDFYSYCLGHTAIDPGSGIVLGSAGPVPGGSMSRFLTLPEGIEPGSPEDPGGPEAATAMLGQGPARGHDEATTSSARTSRRVPTVTSEDDELMDAQLVSDSSLDLALQPSPANVERLRAALGQVTAAVTALHDRGKLHLDIKPSNVLVRADGRVVVLDFGLVQNKDARDPVDIDAVAGTPGYMAPEQAAGKRLTPAADFYAIGVMLYQALAGCIPFADRGSAMMLAKQLGDPPAPSTVATEVPGELENLCMRLLDRDPAKRAGAREISSCLGHDTAVSLIPSSARRHLVGRDEELQRLHTALTRAVGGRPTVAVLRGEAGIGKTALVQHFLEDLRRERRALAFAGRCYERESLPFKAFDDVVDSLAHHLMRLPRSEAAALLPRGAHALARLFPALNRVEALADVPVGPLDIPSNRELRARAFAALKELLRSLCDRSPVVLFIDDGHWGDADSAQLLTELLSAPEPPPILLLTTHRLDVEAAFLSEGVEHFAGARHLDLITLDLAPLSDSDAVALARELTGEAGERAARIAREGEGSPLFIAELARHAEAAASSPESGLQLTDVLERRVRELDAEAAQLLEVIALAGAPIEQGVVARAAGVSGDSQALLGALRGAHLVRTRGSRDTDSVESYHDRVREVTNQLIPTHKQLRLHAALARELEASRRADPEQLMRHLEHGGAPQRAGHYAALAAAKAAEALAFDHAAGLYRRALALAPGAADGRFGLLLGLGRSLQNAGRGREAAETFLEAAAERRGNDAFDLERQAMEQYLICGHTSEGLQVMQRLLRAVDLPFQTTSAKVLTSLLYRRARLKLRGLEFRQRPEATIPHEKLRQLDTCFSVSVGFSAIDPFNAASYQALHLLRALEAGEPKRLAQGLILEAGHQSTISAASAEKTRPLLDRAAELNRDLDEPYLAAFAKTMEGVRQFGIGSFACCQRSCDEAISIYRAHCSGATWEVDTANLFSLFALAARGDLVSLRGRLPGWTKDADERGDLYASISFRVFWAGQTTVLLADGDAGGARDELTRCMARWSREKVYVQHFYELWAQTLIDLYEGRAERAHRRVEERWRPLERSLLTRMQHVNIQIHRLRASAALAVARESRTQRRRLLEVTRRDAKRLVAHDVGWSVPHGQLLLAEVAAAEDQRNLQRELLEQALGGFEEADLRLYTAIARRKLGTLLGGNEGAEHLAMANQYFDEHGIIDPERFEAAFAPRVE